MIVGYARVSTVEQSLEVQVEQLQQAGAEKIFSEKLSGSSAANRAKLQDAIDFVREGDVLIVTRLDRVARSSVDLHNIVQKLTDKGCGFRCTEQSGVDTTSTSGKLMLGLLGAVAEFENGIRKERQMEGIAKAKAKGVYRGRQRATKPEDIRQKLAEGMGPSEAARYFNVSRMTVHRARLST